MTASRMQHIVPATLVLLLAAIVGWISFTSQPSEAFLFPKLISIFFVGLALWNFIRALFGLARIGDGISTANLKNIAPGLAVLLLYVFVSAAGVRGWGLKGLGFYTASTIAFLTVYTLYDPVPVSSLKDWGKRIFVTAVFMTVIYCLFVLGLKVQTPRGIFF